MTTLTEQAKEEAQKLSSQYNIIYLALLKKAIDEELERRLISQ